MLQIDLKCDQLGPLVKKNSTDHEKGGRHLSEDKEAMPDCLTGQLKNMFNDHQETFYGDSPEIVECCFDEEDLRFGDRPSMSMVILAVLTLCALSMLIIYIARKFVNNS